MALSQLEQLRSVVDKLAEESRARATKADQDQERENWLPGYNIILCTTLTQPNMDYPSTAGTLKYSA